MEKDLKVLEKYINGKDTMKEQLVRAIENLLKEIQVKDKIIDLMSEHLTSPIHDKESVKAYFEREAKKR